MNPQGQIYSALSDAIPAEDTARLEGYLFGRAEVEELLTKRMASKTSELETLRAALKRDDG